MYLVLDEALCRDRAAWTAPFDELVDFEGDGSWCGRVTGELAIRLSPDRALVEGELRGLVPRVCDLCLGIFLEPITAQVCDVCLVDGVPGDGPAVFDDDAEAWRASPGGRLDLTEMARQAIVLALPTRALCRSDCPAREAMAAVKPPRQPDPRLAVLSALFEREDEVDGSPEASGQ